MAKKSGLSPMKIILIVFLVLVFLSGIYFIYWGMSSPSPIPSPSPSPIPSPSVEEEPDTTIEIENTSTPTAPSPATIDATDKEKCPDLLVRQGNKLLLINTKIPRVPGKNPIQFNSLDDYIYYIKVQRYKYGQYCPVLYLQQESDIQGQDTYRIRPGPFDMQGGLPTASNFNPSQTGSLVNFFQGNLGNIQLPQGPTPFNMPPTTSPLIPPHPPIVPYTDSNMSRPPYNSGFLGFDPDGEYIGKYTMIDNIHYSTRVQNPNGLSSNAMDPNWAGAQFTNAQLVELDKSLQNQTVDFPKAGSAPGSGPVTSGTVVLNSTDDTISPANYNTPSGPPPFPFGAPLAPTPSSSPSGSGPSDDPMDANWGGAAYTASDVASGKYAGNEVSVYVGK